VAVAVAVAVAIAVAVAGGAVSPFRCRCYRSRTVADQFFALSIRLNMKTMTN